MVTRRTRTSAAPGGTDTRRMILGEQPRRRRAGPRDADERTRWAHNVTKEVAAAGHADAGPLRSRLRCCGGGRQPHLVPHRVEKGV